MLVLGESEAFCAQTTETAGGVITLVMTGVFLTRALINICREIKKAHN